LEKWSLMGGGYLQEVAAQRGTTVDTKKKERELVSYKKSEQRRAKDESVEPT